MRTQTCTITTASLALLCAGTAAWAQTSISPAHKYSWSENCGWMNWRDAGPPAGSAGAQLPPGHNFLTGFVWCENIGWINLGDGSPSNGTAYTNANGSDFGVNLDAGTGNLSGMAWGQNVGWIDFGVAASKGSLYAARIAKTAPRRFYGYAWGENIGWINLNDPTSYVALYFCPADFNQSGVVSVQDIFDFLAAYFAGNPSADFNQSGVMSVQDIFDFLAAYFTGC